MVCYLRKIQAIEKSAFKKNSKNQPVITTWNTF